MILDAASLIFSMLYFRLTYQYQVKPSQLVFALRESVSFFLLICCILLVFQVTGSI